MAYLLKGLRTGDHGRIFLSVKSTASLCLMLQELLRGSFLVIAGLGATWLLFSGLLRLLRMEVLTGRTVKMLLRDSSGFFSRSIVILSVLGCLSSISYLFLIWRLLKTSRRWLSLLFLFVFFTDSSSKGWLNSSWIVLLLWGLKPSM